jgi:hypothetical protein
MPDFVFNNGLPVASRNSSMGGMTQDSEDFHTRLLAEQRRASAARRLKKLASGDYLDLDPGQEASGEDLAALQQWQAADPANRGGIGVNDSKPIKYRLGDGPEQTYEPEGDTYKYKARTLKSSDIGLAKEWMRKNRVQEEATIAKQKAADAKALRQQELDEADARALKNAKAMQDLLATNPLAAPQIANAEEAAAEARRQGKRRQRASEPISVEAYGKLSKQGKLEFDENAQTMDENMAYQKALANDRQREMDAVTELSATYGGQDPLTPNQGLEIDQYIDTKGLKSERVPQAIRNRIGKGDPLTFIFKDPVRKAALDQMIAVGDALGTQDQAYNQSGFLGLFKSERPDWNRLTPALVQLIQRTAKETGYNPQQVYQSVRNYVNSKSGAGLTKFKLQNEQLSPDTLQQIMAGL